MPVPMTKSSSLAARWKTRRDGCPPAALYCNDHVAPMVPTLAAVNGPELASFHEQGFLAIREAFSSDAIGAALAAIDDLIDGSSPTFRGAAFEPGTGRSDQLPADERHLHVRKLMSFIDHDERLLSLSTDPTLLDVVSRLMNGATPELFQDMALLKPAGIGREKAWHQDCAYFNVPTDSTVIGVWIAIDAATLENGCLHVIPESHRRGAHPHFKVRDWQICDRDVRKAESVPVTLDPGGILFWHGLTHHGSPSNRSELGRRGIQLHDQPAGSGTLTKEERLEIYGGEGLGMTC